MATIDKALPNVKQTLTIPGPEEVQEEQQQTLQEQIGKSLTQTVWIF